MIKILNYQFSLRMLLNTFPHEFLKNLSSILSFKNYWYSRQVLYNILSVILDTASAIISLNVLVS